MSKKKVIPLFKVFIPKSIQKPLIKTLFSGWIGHGPRTKEFEKLLTKRFKTKNILTTNTGTSALQLAVRLAGIGPDDEVISTPLTFVATNWAILANGGLPVWADVNENTANIDWRTIEPLITSRTKAIMIVHLGGAPADMDEINAIAKKHNLKVIEDCAHAFGATYKNKPIGTLGDFGAFSFQAVKYLSTADGGLLIVKDPLKFKRAKLLSWYGINKENKGDYVEDDISEWGYKFTSNDIMATIGIEQLKYVNKIIKKHEINSKFYDQRLRNIPGIELLRSNNDRQNSFWLYTLKVKQRENFIRKMKQRGIEVSPVIKRNDEHSCVTKYRRPLPQLDNINKEIVCIPVGWWITPDNRQHIVNSIKEIMG